MKTIYICMFSLFVRSAFAERPMRGIYSVPTSLELEKYSSYPVKFKGGNYSENPSNLSFPLPEELLGTEKWVHFSKQTQTSKDYISEDGVGVCSKEDRYLKCRFTMNNISVDFEKVELSLRQKNLSEDFIAGKLAVAQKFAGEPIGILVYELKGSNK